jgi:hypothetical protein
MKKVSNKLFLAVILLIFIIIVTGSVFMILKTYKKSSVTQLKNIDPNTENPTNSVSDSNIVYKREMFNYSINYPGSLTVKELGSGGGYIDFVRFEENVNPNYKGFAIGVGEQKITNEINRIKAAFEKENAFLAEDANIVYKGLDAKRLDYKPNKVEDGEERVVVIFNKGKYTYSISTVPWQIEDVLKRFEFLQ